MLELRNHPKMRWQGSPSWPPHWTGLYGPTNPLPEGEVGVLTEVELAPESLLAPHCFLMIRWREQDYSGVLFCDDKQFLSEVCVALQAHIGEPISAIGSFTLPSLP